MMTNDDTIRVKKNTDVENSNKKNNTVAKVAASVVGSVAGMAGAAYAAGVFNGDETQPDTLNTEEVAVEETRDIETEGETLQNDELQNDELQNDEQQNDEQQHDEQQHNEQLHDEQHHNEQLHDEQQHDVQDDEDDFFEKNEVEINETEIVENESGEHVILGGTVNGHDAAFISDSDGNITDYIVDENDNNIVEDSEIHHLADGEMDVMDIAMNAEINLVDDSCDDTLQVIAVENDVELNGETVDVAAVKIDNEDVILIDTNQNGEVDLAFADLNHNDAIEDDEIMQLTDEHIDMPTIDEVDDMSLMTSGDDLPDYSSDDFIIL